MSKASIDHPGQHDFVHAPTHLHNINLVVSICVRPHCEHDDDSSSE